MHYQPITINIIQLLSIENTLLDMTINNPIFIFAIITIIWFIPGIIVRRINERKIEINKKKNRIQSYPISQYCHELLVCNF